AHFERRGRVRGRRAHRRIAALASGLARARADPARHVLRHVRHREPQRLERLIELFWPDESGESVAHRLHLAASALRAALRRVLDGFDALRCSGPGYLWHPSLRIVSDVETFGRLYRDGSPAAAREAVGIYAGELLAGEPGEWL